MPSNPPALVDVVWAHGQFRFQLVSSVSQETMGSGHGFGSMIYTAQYSCSQSTPWQIHQKLAPKPWKLALTE